MQSSHVSLNSSQVLIVAIFGKRQQLVRYFRTRHVIVFIGKLRLLILVVLRGSNNNKERLPGRVFIVNLNNKTDLEKSQLALIIFNNASKLL